MARTQSLSATEIQAKIDSIAAISVEALSHTTRKRLNDLAKGIIPKYSSLTQLELAKKLIEISQTAREKLDKVNDIKQLEEMTEKENELMQAFNERINKEIQAQNIHLPESNLIALNYSGKNTDDESNPINIGIRLYLQIKTIVNTACLMDKTSLIANKLGSLCATLASTETRFYPNIGTRKSRRTDYLKAIDTKLCTDTEMPYPDTLRDAVTSFKTMILDAFKAEVVDMNREYTVKVASNNIERTEVDVIELFQDAYKILSNIDKNKWTEIVKALAFATGRRPSEILCSATFTVIDSHHLTFKGQAKRRLDFNPDETLEIPTLINTQLVIKAMEYLESKGKKYEYDSKDHVKCLEICDKKTSKELSRSYTKYKAKDYRAIYGELSYKIFNVGDNYSQAGWFNKVLGHGEGQIATAASYTRYKFDETSLNEFKSLVLNS